MLGWSWELEDLTAHGFLARRSTRPFKKNTEMIRG
jgi:hypothetical protein